MTIAVIPKDQREKVDSGFPNEKKNGFDNSYLKIQIIICILSSKFIVNVYMTH